MLMYFLSIGFFYRFAGLYCKKNTKKLNRLFVISGISPFSAPLPSPPPYPGVAELFSVAMIDYFDASVHYTANKPNIFPVSLLNRIKKINLSTDKLLNTESYALK
jgi:hypothetical protein